MNITTSELIAKNIRKYLDLTEESQADLANYCGVHPSNVTLWLKGKTTPRPEMVDKICRFFGISREELLRDDDSVIATSKSIPLYHTMYHKRQHADEPYIERYFAVDKSIKADFGVIIASDLMSGDGLNIGDIAFFIKNYSYSDGHIYAIWNMKADSVLVKHVYHQDGFFNLLSSKYNEPPILLNHNDALLMGEICGVYKGWKYEEV